MHNKILVVDDSKSWLLFHTKIIKQLYGDLFEVVTAQSALEALNIVKANGIASYPVIITDLQMETNFEPLVAGEWLIQNLQALKNSSSSKIVIISSMYNIEDIAKKYKVDCVSKSRLAQNQLLLKYLFEKLMPFLNNLI